MERVKELVLEPVSADDFRTAMGKFPGAVNIITARHGGARLGITATAVCSVSVEPPSLLACVNRKTGTSAAISQAGQFNISLLARNSDDLALVFAGAQGHTGEDKFAHGAWLEDDRGVPYLKNAVVSFSLDVTEEIDGGSHKVFIGKISQIRQGQARPLLYEGQNFHRLEALHLN